MKTAVSLPDNVFKEIDALAKEQGRSRSEVFAQALKDFLEKEKSKKMLNLLNEIYAVPETAEDKQWRSAAKKQFAKRVLKETY